MISDKRALSLYREAYPTDTQADDKSMQESLVNDVKQILECSSKKEAFNLLDSWDYGCPGDLIDVLEKHDLVFWKEVPVDRDDSDNPYGWTRDNILEGIQPSLEIFKINGELRPLADHILGLIRISVEKALQDS